MATLRRVPWTVDFVVQSWWAEQQRSGLDQCAAALCDPEEVEDHRWKKNAVSKARGVRYGLTDDVHVSRQSVWCASLSWLLA